MNASSQKMRSDAECKYPLSKCRAKRGPRCFMTDFLPAIPGNPSLVPPEKLFRASGYALWGLSPPTHPQLNSFPVDSTTGMSLLSLPRGPRYGGGGGLEGTRRKFSVGSKTSIFCPFQSIFAVFSRILVNRTDLRAFS